MANTASIGASIQVTGELSGKEDLHVEGAIEGKISLEDHEVTVGNNGRVHAEIRATRVVVLGQVVGNITASDRIEIAPSGSVEGDLHAPRIKLEDGARFRGAIDMKPVPGAPAKAEKVAVGPARGSASRPG